MVQEKTRIRLKVKPADIAFLVQVMEGYSHIGVVSTTDPKNGEVELLITPDTYGPAKLILENLPIELSINDD